MQRALEPAHARVVAAARNRLGGVTRTAQGGEPGDGGGVAARGTGTFRGGRRAPGSFARPRRWIRAASSFAVPRSSGVPRREPPRWTRAPPYKSARSEPQIHTAAPRTASVVDLEAGGDWSFARCAVELRAPRRPVPLRRSQTRAPSPPVPRASPPSLRRRRPEPPRWRDLHGVGRRLPQKSIGAAARGTAISGSGAAGAVQYAR